jgi:hypothetical protein
MKYATRYGLNSKDLARFSIAALTCYEIEMGAA